MIYKFRQRGSGMRYPPLLLPGEMNILQIQCKIDFNTFLLRKLHSRCIKNHVSGSCWFVVGYSWSSLVIFGANWQYTEFVRLIHGRFLVCNSQTNCLIFLRRVEDTWTGLETTTNLTELHFHLYFCYKIWFLLVPASMNEGNASLPYFHLYLLFPKVINENESSLSCTKCNRIWGGGVGGRGWWRFLSKQYLIKCLHRQYLWKLNSA